jgi:hypothetical protein
VAPIGVLPDDVLLTIFDFYMFRMRQRKSDVEAWQSLVHVCRRWRCVVLGSPLRLNLRLYCTPKTPVGERLDVWPALPLIVEGNIISKTVDNIVALLGHNDRVCQIGLRTVWGFQWDKVLAAMQVPFPMLTDLLLHGHQDSVIPDTFLGGSAPRLRRLEMKCIAFPGIPSLLSSASHLVHLHLDLSDGPYSWDVSPEVIANCLSVLTSLGTLSLSVTPPDSRSPRPPQITRFILPCLTTFYLEGDSEFVDDLIAQIDAPRLDCLSVTLLDQWDLSTPDLVQFISRVPRFQGPNEARVALGLDDGSIQLLWASNDWRVQISLDESDLPPSSITRVCTRCLPPLPTVVILRLDDFTEDPDADLDWKEDIDAEEWLELLRPFTGVKNLYIPGDFQQDVASALQELVGGRTMQVLPSLQKIFLETFKPSGPFQKAIGQFVAARRRSGHPIAVFPW